MALAAAQHHSAQRSAGSETYEAPTGQNTVKAGRRQGDLKDPGPPWVEAVTVGYVAAEAPLPVVPTLRGEDGVDGTTVSFLFSLALEMKKRERAAWRKWMGLAYSSSFSAGKREKRKKRKKQKLPRGTRLGNLDIFRRAPPLALPVWCQRPA